MTATTEDKEIASEAAFGVAGMDCASCVAHVEKAAGAVPGVGSVNVSLARGQALVHYDPDRASPEQIAERLRGIAVSRLEAESVAGG